MRVETALHLFLDQAAANGRSRHTIAQLERHGRLLVEWMRAEGHGEGLSALSPGLLAQFLMSSHARERPDGVQKKPSSVNALRSSIRTFTHFLRDAGFTREDVGRLIRTAKLSAPPPRALSPGEQRSLIQALSHAEDPESRRDRVLFTLLLRTGLRIASALALDADDFHQENATLQLRVAKGNRPARIPIGPSVVRLLSRHLAGRSLGPMFLARHGGRLSTRHAARRFRIWLRQAEIAIPGGTHLLRHTAAQELYSRSRDPFVVQAVLGHASLSTTLRYAQADEERVRAFLL